MNLTAPHLPFALLWSLLKWIDAPGSIPFLVICLAAGLIVRLAAPRARRATTAWFVAVAALYLALALPAVAALISGALPRPHGRELRAGDRIDVLVVFDGDNRRGRVREAQRVYLMAQPNEVWSLGWEPWMHAALAQAGVPRARLYHDAATTTTREQIAWVASRLRASPVLQLAVVVSRLQAPRVEALMRAERLSPVLVVAPADVEPAGGGLRAFVPTYFALRISRDALYEHAALRYYAWRRWTR
ncbi:MAG: hypothetical protein IT184_09735 [Acidobacteria bacterium]|nr:hypothetical protein [Acidobacteriota bacterium]